MSARRSLSARGYVRYDVAGEDCYSFIHLRRLAAPEGRAVGPGFLLGLKAAGWTEAQILENYPSLTNEDLCAVYAHAQAIIKDEAFVPVV